MLLTFTPVKFILIIKFNCLMNQIAVNLLKNSHVLQRIWIIINFTRIRIQHRYRW